MRGIRGRTVEALLLMPLGGSEEAELSATDKSTVPSCSSDSADREGNFNCACLGVVLLSSKDSGGGSVVSAGTGAGDCRPEHIEMIEGEGRGRNLREVQLAAHNVRRHMAIR